MQIIKSSKVFFIIIAAAMFMTILSFLIEIQTAKATPTSFKAPVTCSTQGTSATALSTTSVVGLTAGTATTTATCNMAKAGLGTELFDQAAFVFQQAGAQAGASTVNITIQDSYDGVDYYDRSFAWNVDENTSSSSPALSASQVFTSTFASSTQNKGNITAANGGFMNRSIRVPVIAPFIRAIVTAPIGSASSTIWGTIIGEDLNP